MPVEALSGQPRLSVESPSITASHNLVHQEVEARITQKTVEIFLFRGKRAASHLRSLPAASPDHDSRTYAELTSPLSRRDPRTHPFRCRQGRPRCPDAYRRHPAVATASGTGLPLGHRCILGLARRYGQERVDAACARALQLNARSYKSVAAILKNGTDRTAPPSEEVSILFHANILGRSYYNWIRRYQYAHSSHGRSLARNWPRRHGRYSAIELQNNPEAAEMPHADWLGLLVDREVTARDNRRLTRRLTSAKLRQAATIENVDYRTARGLDRLSSSRTSPPVNGSRDSNHLVIVGPTGTGKSRLACALSNKACRDGFSVLYRRTSRLLADLAQARGEGRLARLIAA